jgi:exopolysaccharide biosynthesis polyprenyl glycosylphosphotransferase
MDSIGIEQKGELEPKGLEYRTMEQTQTTIATSFNLPVSRIPLPSLRLRFSERKLLLLIIDLFVLNAALFASLIFAGNLQPQWNDVSQHIQWFIVASVVWIVFAVFLDLYDLRKAALPETSLWSVGIAALVTSFVYLLIPFITPELPEARSKVLFFPLLSIAGLVTWRITYATIFVQPVFHQRALIVGSAPSGKALVRLIMRTGGHGIHNSGTGYHLLGFVADREKQRGMQIGGLPVLGVGKDLVHLVKQLHPNEIILAFRPSNSLSDELFEAIIECGEMGIPLTTSTTVYESLTGRVPLRHAGRNLSIVFPLQERIELRLYSVFRRFLDILLSTIGCILCLALMPFVWLGNLFSPGPLFYKQKRVGKSGKVFHILKFRSMINEAEKHTGAVWASKSDVRITFIGRFLRKSRLDELPQFWNILKGEMSLIGPRPERPEFIDQLSVNIPYYRIRHAVKPGITGWAQVRFRYGASFQAAVRKLQYDLYYIKHQGPYLDLLILIQTIKVMLRLKGV